MVFFPSNDNLPPEMPSLLALRCKPVTTVLVLVESPGFLALETKGDDSQVMPLAQSHHRTNRLSGRMAANWITRQSPRGRGSSST